MAGPYTKGSDLPDIAWQQFLEDVKNDELNVPGGVSADQYCKMAIEHSDVRSADPELLHLLRKHLAVKLKEYRSSSGAEHDAVTTLLQSHGMYCRSMGTQKWKRVHNAIAYRYADKNLLTNRMIGRKLGKCKEEIDGDIMAGQKNMVILCCGYPALAKMQDDSYETVERLLGNYMILEAFGSTQTESIIPSEWQQEISEMRAITRRIMESLKTALRIYEIFCYGFDGTERRRMDVVKARYIDSRKSAPEMAKRFNAGLSTIQNDSRITIKRLSEIMFL
jgi:hypothetical protein